MRGWILFGAVFTACAIAHAQTLPTPSLPPPVSDDILRALADTNFATREASQKRLDAIPLDQRDALEHLAHTVNDAEVQARLLARVDDMDTELALNPPLISIDLKNATAQQVAQALAQAMGVYTSARVGSLQANDRFTLSVKDKPFWEVFYALHAQHPITFERGQKGDWILNDDGSKADVPLEFVKGMLVEVSTAKGQALPTPTSRIVAGPGGMARIITDDDPATKYFGGLAVVFRLTADPRIAVQTIDVHVQPDLRDNTNQVLQVIAVGANGTRKAKEFSWGYKISIGTPADLGKTIKSIKATAVMDVPVDMRRVIIDAPAKSLNQPIHVGGATFTIDRFEEAGGRVLYSVKVAPGAPAATAMALIDGDGNRAAFSETQSLSGAESPALKPPYKVELMAPRTIKEVTLPLEWKDVPIEGLPVKRVPVGVPGGMGAIDILPAGDFIDDGAPMIRRF